MRREPPSRAGFCNRPSSFHPYPTQPDLPHGRTPPARVGLAAEPVRMLSQETVLVPDTGRRDSVGEAEMLGAGDYADVLRAVGWMLDEVLDAREPERIDVVVRGVVLEVYWHEPGGHGRRRYRGSEMESLRERARALREGPAVAAGVQAERFRTIGQHLDEFGVRLERLHVEPGGYRIVGMLGWH